MLWQLHLLLPQWKIQNLWICKYFSTLKLRHTSSLLFLWKVYSQCICTGGFRFPHYTWIICILHHDWLTRDINHVQVLLDFWLWKRNFPHSADVCEYNLLVSNSCTNSKLKHSSEVTISKTQFCVERDFNISLKCFQKKDLTFREVWLFALLRRVRWEDWYHPIFSSNS